MVGVPLTRVIFKGYNSYSLAIAKKFKSILIITNKMMVSQEMALTAPLDLSRFKLMGSYSLEESFLISTEMPPLIFADY